ncbi:hypothetical protein KCP73_02185 [Salmonella enterica subsp. enterica]|nr:hypothetical protein KCP73_02185 [Salmonella enterica subsp. enterica]
MNFGSCGIRALTRSGRRRHGAVVRTGFKNNATIILSPAKPAVSVPGVPCWRTPVRGIYQDENCGYDGPPVADEFDKPTSRPEKDKCSHCAERHVMHVTIW